MPSIRRISLCAALLVTSCASSRPDPDVRVASADLCFEIVRLRNFQSLVRKSPLDSARRTEIAALAERRIASLAALDSLADPDASCKGYRSQVGHFEQTESERLDAGGRVLRELLVRVVLPMVVR